jgi:hypothetical protein
LRDESIARERSARAVAAAGDPVADVESAFSVTDLALVDGTPLSVLRECQ